MRRGGNRVQNGMSHSSRFQPRSQAETSFNLSGQQPCARTVSPVSPAAECVYQLPQIRAFPATYTV